jgi:hypothetical protein
VDDEIIIVSGLPRSGTSLLMQMLDKGGIPVVTDHVRTADADNPRGYYELERVKALKRDASWLPELRGKAVKMISQLLYELPSNHRYRVIFMERDLDEVIPSQEKMLARLGKPAAPAAEIKRHFIRHLEHLRDWLVQQRRYIDVLYVRYDDVVERPEEQAGRIAAFLGGRPDPARMIEAIDSSLYRNRNVAT